jgi:pimeloyl-ACP methyl ester carboxylesterase
MSSFPPDFHSRAAIEMARTLKSLGLERPVLWGHSDGAVIAVMMALDNPELYSAIILEAFHFYRVKPASRSFFETMSSNPLTLGERVTTVLSRDHGEDYWQTLILNNGRAWLRIADESKDDGEDLYEGRLSGLSVPTLFIHGGRDPRTEPGELDAVRDQLPQTPVRVIERAGHSPHSEPQAAMECNRLARDFLASISNDISV